MPQVSLRGRGINTTLLLANIHLSPEATSFPVFVLGDSSDCLISREYVATHRPFHSSHDLPYLQPLASIGRIVALYRACWIWHTVSSTLCGMDKYYFGRARDGHSL